MEFRGKSIWLVGASAGIGAALAEALALAGATLILSARDEAALREVATRCPQANPFILPMDVASQISVDAAWKRLSDAGLTVDMLLYNAGAYEPMTAQQYDIKKVQQMVEVNFSGALRVLAHILPLFIARNSGHIALVASVAGYRGLPGAIGYGASKAALIHLAENLRADLAATAVGVSVINPGFVKTRLTDKNDFKMPAMITPTEAAHQILQGLTRGQFEIHFPKRFTRVLKTLRLLPYPVYFRLLRLFRF